MLIYFGIIQVCWFPEAGQGKHSYLRSYCGKMATRGVKAHFMYEVPVGSLLPGQGSTHIYVVTVEI